MSPHNTGTATDSAVGKDNVVPITKPRALPLPGGLSVVEPFDYELLPRDFQAWVQDIAERMQCPPDYPGVAAMVVLASLVGRQISIRPKQNDSWSVVPNLWGGVVGTPGVLKSPSLKETMAAVLKIQANALTEYEEKQTAYAVEEVVYQERVKLDRVTVKESLSNKQPNNAKNSAEDLIDAKPEPPSCKRYIVNDTTVERLQEILSENPNGVLQFRDELTGFLKQMQKPGHETDRAFFLEAWDGNGSHTSDRIGRGMTHIEHACVSILGGIQPGPLLSYFSGLAHGGSGDDGLLQRFQLLVWPDVSREWENIDRFPDMNAQQAAHAVFERLRPPEGPANKSAFLRFSESAQVMFDKWRADLETRLRSGDEPPAIAAHLSKYRSLVPSLALLIHLANDDSGPVTYECAKTAIAWSEYLETHARRVYAPALHPDMESARSLATKIQEGRLGDEFTIKDVYKSHWSNLADSSRAKAAINILTDHYWLEVREEETEGRKRTVYVVNPTVSEL